MPSSNLKINEISQYNADFYNLEAEFYDIKNDLFFGKGSNTYSRVSDVIEFLSKKASTSVIVDIGCGSGNILKAAKKYFKTLVGIDISINMLKKASSFGFNVYCGDINHLCIKTSSADVVSAFSVIHHLYNPSFLFDEVFRVLKPNGFFYSDNDPNAFASDLHDLNKQSFLYRLCMGLYYLPLRFSKAYRMRRDKLKEFSKYLKKNNVSHQKYAELSLNAEYYLNKGIDPYVIKQQLLRAGFIDIQIYCHFSGKRLKKQISIFEKLKILLKILLKKDFSYFQNKIPLKELTPFFAIVARKPQNYYFVKKINIETT